MSTVPTIDYEKVKGVPPKLRWKSSILPAIGPARGASRRRPCAASSRLRVRARWSQEQPVACTWPTLRYMTTPWIVPWMHTQLGAGGSSAVGMAAGLRALKRKGKIKDEKINVINFSGDLGAGDMGIGGISAALQSDYDLLIIMYDNESAANTDIQATGSTTYGAQTTFTPPGTKHRSCRGAGRRTSPACLPSAIRPAVTLPLPAPPFRRRII